MLNFKSTVVKFLATILAFSALAAPALAGSTAKSIAPTVLRFGAGPEYPEVMSIGAAQTLDVERCHERWCLVKGKGIRGWASIEALTFGVEPRGPLSGPKLYRESQGSGTMCFYTGPNFTGASTCYKTGMVVPDLALYGLDNAFASVAVKGTISAHVCREFDFGSYCESIIADQPKLSRFLYRQVSAIRIW